MLDVAEAASGFFHPLDRGIDGLQARVGDPVLEVGQDMGQMSLDHLRDRGHRGRSRLCVARQNQRAKKVMAAPGYV